jgi:succinate dehydrogenase / fumarate reductase cytochrome b subunit
MFCKEFFQSSVGKKYLMATTGFLLCGFLFAHLLGNFLIIVGPQAFNFYAHTLINNKFIYVMEAGLLALFLMHIGLGVRLTLENKAARPEKYYMKERTYRGATFASSTMPYTGMIILVFLISHLLHFKFGPHYTALVEGVGETRDLYKTVIEYFQSPLNVLWYVFAMIATGVHLSHGFQSAFQSYGVNHAKYTPIIKKVGIGFSLFISVGFSFIAIYCHFQGVN